MSGGSKSRTSSNTTSTASSINNNLSGIEGHGVAGDDNEVNEGQFAGAGHVNIENIDPGIVQFGAELMDGFFNQQDNVISLLESTIDKNTDAVSMALGSVPNMVSGGLAESNQTLIKYGAIGLVIIAVVLFAGK